MPRSHTIIRTTGKRKRPASRKYRKPAKKAYRKRVSYRKKAKRGPRNTVAMLRNPDLKPNSRTVQVVFMRTIQVINQRQPPQAAPNLNRYPSAQYMMLNMSSPWLFANDEYTTASGSDGILTRNKWYVNGQPFATHVDGESVRSGTSYNWLFGQGTDAAGPNSQIPGATPGENYGQLLVSRVKTDITFIPQHNVTSTETTQPTTLFGVHSTSFQGRFFVRKYNPITGEYVRTLITPDVCQPDLAGTPNKKYCSITPQSFTASSESPGGGNVKTTVGNARSHGGKLSFDYTPGKFNMGTAKDQKSLRSQIIPQASGPGLPFNVPQGTAPIEMDYLTIGIMPTYAQSLRAQGDLSADPPIEPVYEGNLSSGYIQLRMTATIKLAEPFSIGATVPV